MTAETEKKIDIYEAKRILKNISANLTGSLDEKEFVKEDTELRLEVINGDLCASCERFGLFKRKQNGSERVALRCEAGLSPTGLYRGEIKNKNELRCSKRVPLKK